MNREFLLSGILVLTGIVNTLPLAGIASGEMLGRLYGIDPPTGDLLILMRHRALLFGLLGVLLIVAAFRAELRPAAIIAGLVSMGGFVFLAWLEGSYGAELRKVVVIDCIACVGLILATALLLFEGGRMIRALRQWPPWP